MKIDECKIGMKVVSCVNAWHPEYVITKVLSRTITVEHRTGNKVMRGGKKIDEVFEYPNQRPSTFRVAA